ncbi:MAG: DUF2284 domain-containing protein [Eubacteriaceae bacterium]|nr:DUF2284 domain-containing protein [Eubacteriaceae bacterium]
MLKDELIRIVMDSGFDEYKELSASDIIFSETVFRECARNTCGNYGRNHACPPKSGTMEENKARFLRYDNALLINKVVSMKGGREIIRESFGRMASSLENLRRATENMPVMVAGPGGCNICPECAAKEDEPCRHPDRIRYSMEGSGIDIMTMSIKQKMTYNDGKGGLGYFFIVMY